MQRNLKGLAAFLLVATAGAGASAATDSVAPSAEAVQPLLIGAQVPDATVRALDGSEVELLDVLAKQRSVIVFYRGGW